MIVDPWLLSPVVNAATLKTIRRSVEMLSTSLSDTPQCRGRVPAKVFLDLAETPGVEITVKRDSGALMHLKSYQIDGKLLRTGAANFSASGLKRQDNDLIVIESAGAAASFKRNFDARFASGEDLAAGAKR